MCVAYQLLKLIFIFYKAMFSLKVKLIQYLNLLQYLAKILDNHIHFKNCKLLIMTSSKVQNVQYKDTAE